MNSSGSENVTAFWSAEEGEDGDHEVTAMKVAFAVIEFLIGTLIICTNSLIVYAISTRAYLKNKTNKLVLHLAITDGFTGVVMIYYALLDVFPDLEYNKWSCVVMLSTIMFPEVSTLLLGIIALDRYIAIIHPLRYHSLLTERTINMLAAGCWITGTTIYIAAVSTADWSRMNMGCTKSYLLNPTYNILIMIVQFFSFNIYLCYIYTRIFLVAKKQITRVDDYCNSTISRNNIIRQELRAAKMTVFVVIVFAVDYWPAVIALLVNQFLGVAGEKMELVIQVVMILILNNAMFNVVIYAFSNTNFKRAFKSILCRTA